MRNCKNCGFIQEDLEKIKKFYEKHGYPEYYNEDDLYRECYCDKIGGKIGLYGYCSDAIELDTENKEEKEDLHINETIRLREKSRRKRKNDRKYKTRLKRQSEVVSYYPGVAYPVYKQNSYDRNKEDILYYKPTNKSKHSLRYSYFKKVASKSVRNSGLEQLTGKQRGLYKKVFDYKWTVD